MATIPVYSYTSIPVSSPPKSFVSVKGVGVDIDLISDEYTLLKTERAIDPPM